MVEDAEGHRDLHFRKGPVFTQVLLVDEINRAVPRTQSALLEAMQERSVSAGGETHQLDSPFFVMATQNPIEQEGTYALPEAQLDRFLIKVTVPYARREEMNEILRRHSPGRTSVSYSIVRATKWASSSAERAGNRPTASSGPSSPVRSA